MNVLRRFVLLVLVGLVWGSTLLVAQANRILDDLGQVFDDRELAILAERLEIEAESPAVIEDRARGPPRDDRGFLTKEQPLVEELQCQSCLAAAIRAMQQVHAVFREAARDGI